MKHDRITALVPVAIAIDHLKIGRRNNTLKARGTDLDSGRRVTLELAVEGQNEPYAVAEAQGPLVLVITIERLALI